MAPQADANGNVSGNPTAGARVPYERRSTASLALSAGGSWLASKIHNMRQGWIERIVNGREQQARGGMRPDQSLWNTAATGFGYDGGLSNADWNETEALKSYVGPVYVAVSAIAKRIPSALEDLALVRRDKATGDEEELASHPILDALNRPNEYMDRAYLLQLTAMHLKLAGNAYWAILPMGGSGQRRVQGFFPLMPHLTRIVASREPGVLIKGYNVYPDGVGGRSVFFDAADVIHFKEPNPNDLFYGWSPLRAAAHDYDAHQATRDFRTNWFRNQARPDYVLSVDAGPGEQGEAAMERVWAQIMMRHQGAKRTGLPMVLPVKGMDLKTLGFSMKDMEFVEIASLTERQILKIFGVNRYAAGDFDQSVGSRAEAEQADVQFVRAAVQPTCDQIVSALQLQLVERESLVADPSRVYAFLRYPSPIPADRELEHKELTEMFAAKAITRNEYREAKGWAPYEPGDGPGDVVFVPFGEVPLTAGTMAASESAVVEPATASAAEPKPEPVAEPVAGEEEGAEGPKTIESFAIGAKSVSPSKAARIIPLPLDTAEKRAAHWEKTLPALEINERRIERVVRTAFRAQAKRLRPLIESTVSTMVNRHAGQGRRKVRKSLAEWIRKASFERDFPMEDETEELADDLGPSVRGAYESGGKQAARMFGLDFDVQNPDAIKWLNQHTAKLAGDINEETKRAVTQAIADGVSEGESIEQIMHQIYGDGGVFEQCDRVRAARIARTETTTAFNRGTVDQWQDPEMEGIVEKKMWVTARDSNVREDHAAVDGTMVGLDESFTVGGYDMEFPGDPSAGPDQLCNCRCVTSAVLSGEGE